MRRQECVVAGFGAVATRYVWIVKLGALGAGRAGLGPADWMYDWSYGA